ncbi:bifunctional tRNA (5-methylaminomethyl-2-thiouridine)(34)-methyltransferase MnmD/FAD-dependent 5-carboxymethylaminomethyl-2-thiouridine(34) oxidoreductase MnmC [Thioflexithrix psekupsensis]|uniref:tRNA 5-methylaminomethyl-2-thiouridine biosynthesis bifunctional protein MnmC n=1 Tax=Thioflexithrix psekupsensis TaxID=1570016 RepID=A0A251XAN8_9GAMM|nr:bifunctional tRNA (5-methylaminomethyl-2-thiouridine)(34)-methyltransferase MnmD/FAD-dependent 5-carboxymethylaminomethyl-2-thiouridine(34) oxidoreductase MnmC [Thioflexithrix psekupsensis]OUD15439.1 bifunctional tRNA (5-methylaminomethyl-2-thiouridine)(34)-methyltransferase MnmD/FAD-dependent 5-carboxymethylaminomethyl-2-thiouridine(34) oxidoreductase MnmC [Thioflexithrix psekupsensis]
MIITPADLQWNEQGLPYSSQFKDIYFSTENGVAESEYVFLQANDLPNIFLNSSEQKTFVIGEIGFGSGLNFLLTWQRCVSLLPENSHQQLCYIAFELHPFLPDDMRRAIAAWPSLKEYGEQLLSVYPPLVEGCHTLRLGRHLTLQLYFGEAFQLLSTWPESQQGTVDVWFLDGFAPARNPELWQIDLLQHISRFSRPNARFSTFTAASWVRKNLQTAGFVVEKIAGFGRKREMLRGYLSHSTQKMPKNQLTPPWWRVPLWDLSNTEARHVAILGAGLAGCACAYRLSQQGWQCTLIDQADSLASAASGNRQGAFYPLLTRQWQDAATQFYVSAFLYLINWLHQSQEEQGAFAHARCGVAQLATDSKTWERFQAILEALPLPDTVLKGLSAAEITALSGIHLDYPALFFPQGGWLSPRQWADYLWKKSCTYTTDNQVILGQKIVKLARINEKWHLFDENQHCVTQASVVILANAYDVSHFFPHLPVTAVRGQVSYPKATKRSLSLQQVLCHSGYVTPAWDGAHSVGASYQLDSTELVVSPADNIANAYALATAIPHFAAEVMIDENTPARASLRCASRDHLPLIGFLPDETAFMRDYAEMAKGHRYSAYPELTGTGLYVSVAHGSRGIVSTPLAAEIICAQLCGYPLPISEAVMRAIAPQRFWVRGLKGGRG